MKLGITHLSQIPVREKPSHSSQMVTQLIFGETYKIIKNVNKDWIEIQCTYDNYTGYIASNQLFFCDLIYSNNFVLKSKSAILSKDSITKICSMGSVLPKLDSLKGKFEIVEQKQQNGTIISDISLSHSEEDNEDYAILIAKRSKEWLDVPYLWGGRTIFGVDCSGFTQIIFKTLNIKLPRDAYQQAEIGEKIPFLKDVRCGDLAFFDNEQGKITHVGILLESNKIIHASGKVKIDKIDETGIYCGSENEYTHKLKLIKRII